jgi:hypothetical protein
MTYITDANDRATLEAIGRNPGVKRSHWSVTKAAVTRLIQADLVIPPNSSGKLYLTDVGKAVLEHLDAVKADAGHAGWCAGPSAHLRVPMESAPMKDSELGRFVCVPSGDCLHSPDLTIHADGVWVRSPGGNTYSSAHRDCFEARRVRDEAT